MDDVTMNGKPWHYNALAEDFEVRPEYGLIRQHLDCTELILGGVIGPALVPAIIAEKAIPFGNSGNSLVVGIYF